MVESDCTRLSENLVGLVDHDGVNASLTQQISRHSPNRTESNDGNIEHAWAY
jgi:hypothetical protein